MPPISSKNIAFAAIGKAKAKVILRNFGLSTDGDKGELQQRIKNHVGQDQALRQQVADSLNQASEALAAKKEAAAAARSAAAAAEQASETLLFETTLERGPPSRDEMFVGPGDEVFINIPPEPQVETKPKEELVTHEVEKIVERMGHARQHLDDQTGKIGEGARIHGRYTPAMMYHHQMRKQLAQWNRHNLFYPYQNTVQNHGKRFLMLNRSAHYE